MQGEHIPIQGVDFIHRMRRWKKDSLILKATGLQVSYLNSLSHVSVRIIFQPSLHRAQDLESSINDGCIRIMQSHPSALFQESWIIISILMDANSAAGQSEVSCSKQKTTGQCPGQKSHANTPLGQGGTERVGRQGKLISPGKNRIFIRSTEGRTCSQKSTIKISF